MSFPKLKHALFCRILIYVMVIGSFLLPAVAAVYMSFIPEQIRVIILLLCITGLLVFIVKNFAFLFITDMMLARLRCRLKARKQFVLPDNFSEGKMYGKISRFGKTSEPTISSPYLKLLQYKSKNPLTVYSSGIEKIVALYEVDILDKTIYDSIVRSATASSKALTKNKKHYFLDKAQKKAPLNCTAVIIISAKQIDNELRNKLHKIVAQTIGDESDNIVLPCVIDNEKKLCTFDSECIPYIGFGIAAKNRGIKIIRRFLFNNRFTYSKSLDTLSPLQDMDTEQSLWSFLRTARNEIILEDKKQKTLFEKMDDREIIVDDDYIYLKLQEHGYMAPVEFNNESMIAETDEISFWTYPKTALIPANTIKEIENIINSHFAAMGYNVKYIAAE